MTSRGQKVKEIRLQKGLTQMQFADLINSTQTTIGKIETNTSKVNVDQLRIMLKENIIDANKVIEIIRMEK